LENEDGGKNFKAASEFDSWHDFVALLDMKWKDRKSCLGMDLGGRVLPCSKRLAESAILCRLQMEIINFDQKIRASWAGNYPIDSPFPKEYFGVIDSTCFRLTQRATPNLLEGSMRGSFRRGPM
jgi:hypothetical protein